MHNISKKCLKDMSHNFQKVLIHSYKGAVIFVQNNLLVYEYFDDNNGMTHRNVHKHGPTYKKKKGITQINIIQTSKSLYQFIQLQSTFRVPNYIGHYIKNKT